MADDVITAQEKSRLRFNEFVKPYLEKFLDAKIIDIETADESIKQLLDTAAGIDYIVKSNGILRGLSSRIQDDKWITKYRTFTIRESRRSGARTELRKLTNAIENGGLCPYWTVQAYFDKDELNRFAVAETRDVLELAIEKLERNKTGVDQIGQATFLVVWWRDLRGKGRFVHIWPDDESQKHKHYQPTLPGMPKNFAHSSNIR